MIKSPYNFVPAPKKDEVFTPDWADQVSHDMPFSDGESGEIEFTITAETPIFIRNGHSKQDYAVFEKWRDQFGCDESRLSDEERERLDRYLSFSNYNGKYFIPATSIKGMLRNVLEIMSFSKFQNIDETKFYGLRDMNNPQYKNETNQRTLKSGWLKRDGQNWVIEEVEHGRIRMSDIEQKFNLNRNTFADSDAVQKYKILEKMELSNNFSFDSDLIKVFSPTFSFNYGKLYTFSDGGQFQGTLVFYGKIDNKHYDFIFKNEAINTFSVEDRLVQNMYKLYSDDDLSLWNYFKNKVKIPVFFRVANNVVKHFGFSKLYRLNNGHYIKESETMKYHNSVKKLDFVTSLFGETSENRNYALKGRVFVSHALIDSDFQLLENRKLVLSSPKSSFYPAYLTQPEQINDANPYKTYVSDNFEIRGYKRYPVHNRIKQADINDNTEILSFIRPLDKGLKFKGKIRYHNLKPAEIGGLISALTFHGNKGLYHSIGSAKPYGYGKIIFSLPVENWNKYLSEFENELIKHKPNWLNSDQIKELFSMAKNPEIDIDNYLIYPQLEKPNVPARHANEFNNIKSNRQYLEPYSKYNTIGDISSITNLYKLKQNEEDEILFKTAFNDFYTKRDIKSLIELLNKYPDFAHKHNLRLKIDEVEELAFNEMINRRDLDELRNFRENNPLHPNIDQINRLIRELAPQEYPVRFRTLSIDNLLKEALQPKNDYIKQSFQPELMLDIERAIRAVLPDNRERRKWESFDNNNTWGKVKQLIGDANANDLFRIIFGN